MFVPQKIPVQCAVNTVLCDVVSMISGCRICCVFVFVAVCLPALATSCTGGERGKAPMVFDEDHNWQEAGTDTDRSSRSLRYLRHSLIFVMQRCRWRTLRLVALDLSAVRVQF